MFKSRVSNLSQANSYFRQGQFDAAIVLYENLFNESDEPTKSQIGFNLSLVKRRFKESLSLSSKYKIANRNSNKLILLGESNDANKDGKGMQKFIFCTKENHIELISNLSLDKSFKPIDLSIDDLVQLYFWGVNIADKNIATPVNNINVSAILNISIDILHVFCESKYIDQNPDILSKTNLSPRETALHHFLTIGVDEIFKGTRYPTINSKRYNSSKENDSSSLIVEPRSRRYPLSFMRYLYSCFINRNTDYRNDGSLPELNESIWKEFYIRFNFELFEAENKSVCIAEKLYDKNSALEFLRDKGVKQICNGLLSLYPNVPKIRGNDYLLIFPDVFLNERKCKVYSAIDHYLLSGALEISMGTRRSSLLDRIQNYKPSELIEDPAIPVDINIKFNVYVITTDEHYTANVIDTIESCKQLACFSIKLININTLKLYNENSTLDDNILKEAKGKSRGYSFFITAGDILLPGSYPILLNSISANNDVPYIYFDEDLVDQTGVPRSPQLKPAFSKFTLLGFNFIGCAVVYKDSFLQHAKFVSTKNATSFTYNLLLQLSDYGDKPVGLQKVLYRRRNDINQQLMVQGTETIDELAAIESRDVLNNYLKSINHNEGNFEVTSGNLIGTFKVFNIVNAHPRVSIIIPFKDESGLLLNCIESIYKYADYLNFEVICVNNNSIKSETNSAIEIIKTKFCDVIFVEYNFEFNYSAINNFAVNNLACGPYLLFLNNDVEFFEFGWLNELVSLCQLPGVGAVGAKLYYPDNTIQHNGLVLAGNTGHVVLNIGKALPKGADSAYPQLCVVSEWSAATAACLLVKKEVFSSVGGFDETNLSIAYNDVDLCLKIRELGFSILVSPFCRAYHYESKSRGLDTTAEKVLKNAREKKYFIKRHRDTLSATDPFFNRNLSINSQDYGLKLELTKFADQSLGIEYEDKIFYEWKTKSFSQKKRVCIFAHYDKDAYIHGYVNFYIEKLSLLFDVYFVSAAECLPEEMSQLQQIETFCKGIVVRANVGYDFGSWRCGLETLGDKISEYDEMLLCNDSVYGPVNGSFDEIVKYFSNSDLDVMSVTDSFEIQYHLQSYFVMYKKPVFTRDFFAQFWSRIKLQKSKWDIIFKYEIGLSDTLTKSGFTIGSYCGDPDQPVINISHFFWRELILNSKCPFIKVELIRDNPAKVDICDWERFLVDNSIYDPNLIREHLNN